MTDDLVGRLRLQGMRVTPDVHDACNEAAARIEALEAENRRLREAHKVMRNGYADAASGLHYVLKEHGRLSGVGFDRVEDHFFEWVTMREREGLLAGSSSLTPEAPHAD